MTRADASLKLAGAATYGADLEAPKMLWAALVPAPVAHGRITKLNLRAARSMPGVVAVVGPGELRRILGLSHGDPEHSVFPETEITYLNQPVAAVAAEAQALARAAARRVVCSVDPLPVVTDIEEIFPEWPGSEARNSPHVIAHVHARHGDVEATFQNADLVHSETYRTSGVEQVALEPHACLADVKDGVWRVTTSTQTPFGVREDLTSILGLPEEKIVVEPSWVGGGFGGKATAVLEPFALVLSAVARRPVKLALSFREEFLLGRSTLPSVARLDTAVKDGKIAARRVRLLLDGGASLPGRDFAAGYAIGFLLGPYRTPVFEVEGYALRTNKPPFGPHRAPFAPQGAFMAESHIDSLAHRLGVDPVAFRIQHAWNEGDSTPYGQKVTSIGLLACLERARATIGRWRNEKASDEGLGVGVGFWSTVATMGGEARLKLTAHGLEIEQGERDIGSGSVIRGLEAVAEQVLGLPAEAIRVTTLDTSQAPFDAGVFGSRTVAALGQAVEKAALTIVKTLTERVSAEKPVHLEWKSGRVMVRAGRTRWPLSELLTADERARDGLVAQGRHYGNAGTIDEHRVVEGAFYPYTDFTASVHLAQVSVDRETGAVKVTRYAAYHDVGKLLDPEMFRGQVEGGVAMGLGAALTEETNWDSTGHLLNPTLLDYRIPTLGEVPPIEVAAIEGFAGAGPFGAKGLGEPPIIPVIAAVANAVYDATGARVTESPLSAERVARALKLI